MEFAAADHDIYYGLLDFFLIVVGFCTNLLESGALKVYPLRPLVHRNKCCGYCPASMLMLAAHALVPAHD